LFCTHTGLSKIFKGSSANSSSNDLSKVSSSTNPTQRSSPTTVATGSPNAKDSNAGSKDATPTDSPRLSGGPYGAQGSSPGSNNPLAQSGGSSGGSPGSGSPLSSSGGAQGREGSPLMTSASTGSVSSVASGSPTGSNPLATSASTGSLGVVVGYGNNSPREVASQPPTQAQMQTQNIVRPNVGVGSGTAVSTFDPTKIIVLHGDNFERKIEVEVGPGKSWFTLQHFLSACALEAGYYYYF
jgi:hypothetical protein